jgi:hypothetical protein
VKSDPYGKLTTRAYCDMRHKEKHKMLQETGTWHEDILVTITSSAACPRYSADWYRTSWRKILRKFNKLMPGVSIKYYLAANRGESGREQASCHLIFEDDNEDILRSTLDIIKGLWLQSYGGGFEITNAGGQASHYASKNAVQLDAIEEHHRYKL